MVDELTGVHDVHDQRPLDLLNSSSNRVCFWERRRYLGTSPGNCSFSPPLAPTQARVLCCLLMGASFCNVRLRSLSIPSIFRWIPMTHRAPNSAFESGRADKQHALTRVHGG